MTDLRTKGKTAGARRAKRWLNMTGDDKKTPGDCITLIFVPPLPRKVQPGVARRTRTRVIRSSLVRGNGCRLRLGENLYPWRLRVALPSRSDRRVSLPGCPEAVVVPHH